MPTLIRPCIDLHQGVVKQLVGSTLRLDQCQPNNESISEPKCNYQSVHPPSYYANIFRSDDMSEGHVILLGQGLNIEAAKEALSTWPGALHVGGGVCDKNAREWLDSGASKIILTSWLFNASLELDEDRLRIMSELFGRNKIVVDLSCRQNSNGAFCVCLNGWNSMSATKLDDECISIVSEYCDEILVHAIANEGKSQGIDRKLVQYLGSCPCKGQIKRIVYAGGVKDVKCLQEVEDLTRGEVDVTVGSALDIYGGSGILYSDCVKWNKQRR